MITGTNDGGQTCAEILGADFCKKDGVLAARVSDWTEDEGRAPETTPEEPGPHLYAMVPIIGDRDTRKRKD